MYDFTNYTAEQLEARAKEILQEMTKDGANLEELRKEAQAIAEERSARAANAARTEIRNSIAAGAGRVVGRPQTAEREERSYDADSPEYRSAWLKNLCVRDGVHLLGEMTEEERAAFTHTTANSGSVVPTPILNQIIDLVESEAPMYDDAEKSGMTQGFGIPRRTGITAGDAAGKAEGADVANDEQNAFDLVPLDGIEIAKYVVISRKMKFKSIDAFEAWLVKELGERIATAKEAVILARLDGTAPAGGSAVAAAAIAAANVNAAVPKTDAGIRAELAKLKGKGQKIIYANASTIYNTIAGIQDTNKHPLFMASAMDDPTVAGVIYGAKVKEDVNLADGVFYIVVKGQLLANDYDDLTIFSSTLPKSAAECKTAYSLFDAGLKNPKGAVKGTFAS
ncbi:MAG: phage major capsid protein [Bacteroidales bacterium]|jgi:HK97 family phage major capsid protein|nr:phage major capsid protein [Bacteroidales bacterium]